MKIGLTTFGLNTEHIHHVSFVLGEEEKLYGFIANELRN